MPALQGKFRPQMWVVFGSVLLCGMSAAQLPQQPALPPPPGQSGRGSFGRGSGDDEDPLMRHAQIEAAKQQNADRQKKMVAETDKILQLAQELNAAVDKGDKDTLSSSEAKKIDEIEKLAKSVRDRMRMD